MANLTVANEILNQLGNRRFIAMTGATNFITDANALIFKIMKNEKKVTHIRITLVADLYNVEFINVRGLNYKTLETVEMVHAENLRNVFTANTGLDTNL